MVRPLLFATTLLAAAPAAAETCRDRLTPSVARLPPGNRALTPQDLIGLRDFGPPYDIPGGDRSFAVSPDRRRVALILRRADPATNSYCIGLVVVTAETGAAGILDSGGDPIFAAFDLHGLADQRTGAIDPPAPVWSPDGRRIAFLRRDQGRTRLWLVDADGKAPARSLTNETSDVRRFAWTSNGTRLIYSVRRGIGDAQADIDVESRSGFIYDHRFWPMADARPLPPASVPFDYRVVDLDGSAHPTSDADRALLAPAAAIGIPANATLRARREGASAWVAPRYAGRYTSPGALTARVNDRLYPCDAPACAERVVGIWWTDTGDLLFLRDWVGEKAGHLEFFRWRPGSAPVSLYETADDLTGCQRGVAGLLCAREAAQRPRELVSVLPKARRIVPIYDPNPEFAAFRLGAVTRLPARASDGAMSFADLVLPPDHRPGEHHPLVIIQYNSRGFLRGGTGDEYPIFLFAQRGFAVLSYQRPQSFAFGSDTRDFQAFQRLNVKDWADRRRAFTALDSAIDAAIARGVIDPTRIGITGLSDGASTVQWALLNSDRFRTAVISSCCEDPGSVTYGAGLAFQDDIRKFGYPLPGPAADVFWRPFSLARNAGRVHTPLLIQAADREFRAALETVGSLRDAGNPVEMFVFPDEYHLKWQPAHRLAIYDRVVDWFDFWLRGEVDPDPAKAAHYARWRALAARPAS
ncbi:Atxe2 family lasso peptide isopeptidase [Sphingomonas sp. CL5.1]|uniref:Atxe2 family lasso peptide isopeptidase n=1 Tax=Sphingomonas sp. CL5.1 TaxID=2653203 RepID=UPI001582BCE5|nr:Atxe2 family lasso peptide isopeptidase [Sphingomonas sp. CL5.1]QKR98297.1 Atxe2 family lasso peptide isopeptidase [Sphingomonas sp. CL5.1]